MVDNNEIIEYDEELLKELNALIGTIQTNGGIASLFRLGLNIYGLVQVFGRTSVHLNIHGSGYMFNDASQFSAINYTIPYQLFGKDYREWQTVADTVSGTVEIPNNIYNISSNFIV